jgi:GAF domain-containing protein
MKGEKEIRMPFSKGIVGHVFTTGEMLNVLNAYGDHRFDKSADKSTGYRTNTILAAPIMELANNNIIGVLQVINKNNGYFTKDDEILLGFMCSIVGISLKNALRFDETVIYHNSLRHLLII